MTRDREARYIEAAIDGMLVGCLYRPNGNPQPGPKFDYKLAWFERLIAHAAELYAAGVPAVLAGDYNVVPTELDIYETASWDKTRSCSRRAARAYARLLAQGWTDALRALHPDERDVHVLGLLAQALGARRRHAPRSSAAQPGTRCAPRWRAAWTATVRGVPGASDHAPAWISLTIVNA